MSSPDSSLPPAGHPAQPAGQPAAPATPGRDALIDRTPKVVTVMHPVGIPPYAADGLDLGKPLFARVTYRPSQPPF